MGKQSAAASEEARYIATSAFSGTGNGTTLSPQSGRPFNMVVSGTFVGTVVLEKSLDGGTTYVAVHHPGTDAAVSYTAPRSVVLCEPEPGALYRPRCSAWTSGTINVRLSH